MYTFSATSPVLGPNTPVLSFDPAYSVSTFSSSPPTLTLADHSVAELGMP